MLRDIMRILGAACILTGIALYFLDGASDGVDDEVGKSQLQAEIAALQEELQTTEEALAQLQQASSAANKSSAENEKKKTEDTEAIQETVLYIKEGANSTSVANDLVRLGLIQDAGQFDSYLAQHELSGKIQIGEYTLDKSMSMETIASTITSSP